MNKQTMTQQELRDDGKRAQCVGKQFLRDEGVLSLARSLASLLNSSYEYCTPGHRMGHSYRLLLARLQQGA